MATIAVSVFGISASAEEDLSPANLVHVDGAAGAKNVYEAAELGALANGVSATSFDTALSLSAVYDGGVITAAIKLAGGNAKVIAAVSVSESILPEITFTVPSAPLDVIVLHQRNNGKWETLSARVGGNKVFVSSCDWGTNSNVVFLQKVSGYCAPAVAVSAPAVVECAPFSKGIVTASKLNFRAGASVSSAVIRTLCKGTAVDITGVCGSWYKVCVNGKEGYVHSSYVRGC